MSVATESRTPAILTTREMEVLELVATGLSAKEIAQRIAIAPRTVERHIDNARLKMHARNRAHLVTCAIVSGLLNAAFQAEQLLAHGRAMLGAGTPGASDQLATSIYPMPRIVRMDMPDLSSILRRSR